MGPHPIGRPRRDARRRRRRADSEPPEPRWTITSTIPRLNAWLLDAANDYVNHAAAPHKAEAFAGLADAAHVVEIGAGSGANVGYLSPGTALYAVEPNEHAHERLRRRCDDAGVTVRIQASGAEHLELETASVDDVICSLVLCTTPDPVAVLAEVRRVLRPGGRFRFVEHVVAPSPGPRRAAQHLLRRPWSWVFDGCDITRPTASLVDDAGFARVHVEHRRFRHSPAWLVNTAVWGIAVR